MKVIWLWVAIAVFFTIGALRVVLNGELPNEIAPQRIMNSSNFNSPEQIGAVVFRRFWQEFNSENIVVLGSYPQLFYHKNIWDGLISVANKNKLGFEKIYEQKSLHQFSSQSTPLNWDEINELASRGGRILVHVEATNEMWLQARSKIKKGFFIFQALLPISEIENEQLRQQCEKLSAFGKYEVLECAAMSVGRRGRKTKEDSAQFSAIIEKLGKREHILYVHEP